MRFCIPWRRGAVLKPTLEDGFAPTHSLIRIARAVEHLPQASGIGFSRHKGMNRLTRLTYPTSFDVL